jgi:hypothetical protein
MGTALMYKFNGGAGCIICDYCRIIIQEPASRFNRPTESEDICDKCFKQVDDAAKWLKENREDVEDMLRNKK